jgi:hypothetical protein
LTVLHGLPKEGGGGLEISVKGENAIVFDVFPIRIGLIDIFIIF